MKHGRTSVIIVFLLSFLLMLSACANNVQQSDSNIESSGGNLQEAEIEEASESEIEEDITSQLVIETETAESSEAAIESFEEEIEDTPEVAALKESIRNVEIGETFFLGAVEQDNDLENGSEAIEWIMLHKTEKEAFVISKKVLEYMQFAIWYTNWSSLNENGYTYGTNPHSTFRWSEDKDRNPPKVWLRDTVYEYGFTDIEKKMIKLTHNTSAFQPCNQIDYTSEYLYIPSLEEVELYMQNVDLLQAEKTDYVNEKMNQMEEDTVNWWLREQGVTEGYAAQVLANGEISDAGAACNSYQGVRPVMWLDIS